MAETDLNGPNCPALLIAQIIPFPANASKRPKHTAAQRRAKYVFANWGNTLPKSVARLTKDEKQAIWKVAWADRAYRCQGGVVI